MSADEHREGRRVAVIGSGVAGLTAAWVLARHAEVTLFETQDRLGGHAHTHRVQARTGDPATIGIDSGFIVHNDHTYPTLLRLFEELGVATQETDMSMSVRCDGCGLEYAGARGIRGLFADHRTIVRGRYLRMLAEIPRFHRIARAELARGPDAGGLELRTLGEFLSAERFSPYFVSHFMVPLVAAVWSCAPQQALRYPVRYLLTFLEHHGMLSVFGSPVWRTVTGGSAQYVNAVAGQLHSVHSGVGVRRVSRTADGVAVRDDADSVRLFDAAVIATHPGDALRVLDTPSRTETEILASLRYSANHTTLHTDASILPRHPGARASWNYRLPRCNSRPDRVLVSYDLNRLHRLGQTTDRHFVVTLGGDDRIDPDTVIDSMIYEHPQYSVEFVTAQRRLGELGDDRIAFAGAYHGWGFHEDGASSGVAAAARLGAEWTAAPIAPVNSWSRP